MNRRWINRIRRGLRKPPQVVAQVVLDELRARTERHLAPRRAAAFRHRATLLRALKAQSVEALWQELAHRPYPTWTSPIAPSVCESVCPGESARILAAADAAVQQQVQLLGSGP